MSFILTIDMSKPAGQVWTSTYNQELPKIGSKRASDAKLLSKKRLEQFLPYLKSQFPKISPVYHLAVNVLNHRFEWPGMGMFTTGQYAKSSVVIYKPTGSSKRHTYYPVFGDCLRVFIYARSANVLQETMKEYPKMLDWNMPIVFADLDVSLASVLRGQQGIPGNFEIVAPETGMRTAEKRFWFDLQESYFQRLPFPKYLHMGQLSLQHLEHIMTWCDYSNLWRGLLSHMLSNGFPSAALFAAGSKSRDPVAYCMYLPHGCIRAVYVHPDFMGRDLFRVVLVALLIRLKNLGMTSVWMDTGSMLFPSQIEDIRSLGGRKCKGQRTCWMKYTPGNKDSRNSRREEGCRVRSFQNVRQVTSAREVDENLSLHEDTGSGGCEDADDSAYIDSNKRTTRSRRYDAGERSPGKSGRRKSLLGYNERGFRGLREDPYEFCEHEDMTESQRRKR